MVSLFTAPSRPGALPPGAGRPGTGRPVPPGRRGPGRSGRTPLIGLAAGVVLLGACGIGYLTLSGSDVDDQVGTINLTTRSSGRAVQPSASPSRTASPEPVGTRDPFKGSGALAEKPPATTSPTPSATTTPSGSATPGLTVIPLPTVTVSTTAISTVTATVTATVPTTVPTTRTVTVTPSGP